MTRLSKGSGFRPSLCSAANKVPF